MFTGNWRIRFLRNSVKPETVSLGHIAAALMLISVITGDIWLITPIFRIGPLAGIE